MKLLDVTFRDAMPVPGCGTTRRVQAGQLDALEFEAGLVSCVKGTAKILVPVGSVVFMTPADAPKEVKK